MTEAKSLQQRFVEYALARVQEDSAFRAALRRADNPNTESAAWQYVLPFCDLNNSIERRAFCLIGAAIAKEMPSEDGTLSLGAALRSVCEGESEEELNREASRLRRLLACNSRGELLQQLGHQIRFLQSRRAALSYSRTLADMLYWNERTRIAWTRDFFVKAKPQEEEVANVPK
ncbi:MAG: type I-E CRISPR-associated protein Cse2/CasB [Lentisphaeria bacterium]|nr:type I-E CRISPR-associated protein Cse2/CasB [Lentisphaeria bacterium]